MIELFMKVADASVNPSLFLYGMGCVYLSGLVLLVAVVVKFFEHARNHQPLKSEQKHNFSTMEMTVCVLMLFPFWVNSIGQIEMNEFTQYAYFAVGFIMLLLSIVWHIWAKINIKYMWSDGIEIKQEHNLVTNGAFAVARHPMYASLLMWCWGASLMMFNWITLLLVTIVFLPLLIKRAKDEEKALCSVNTDYLLYQRNVNMLTPTVSGILAVMVKVAAVGILGYFVWVGMSLAALVLMFFIHLYLGYSLKPEKVAFSYRSKSGMMVVVWALSVFWQPVYYIFWLILFMFVYGLKFNCPCMMVYDKYQRCPCFALLGKCVIRK